MPQNNPLKGYLLLEDGSRYDGFVFGAETSTSGEVVFSTGMVGYTESLTDPSYYGQVLSLTYPLIGNYGVADPDPANPNHPFESERIQAKALIVSEYSQEYDHWNAIQSLSQWMKRDNVPGLYGVDTRSLTKHLREQGTMLGKVIVNEQDVPYYDPNKENLLTKISIPQVEIHGNGAKKIALLDCGCKTSIITNLTDRGLKVHRLPWDYDISGEKFDGLVISSGPGDPATCGDIIQHIKTIMQRETPILGICLGHQLMGIASGAKTYKLKYGHRSQNQPVIHQGTNHCYVTSQNHGFAVDASTLSEDWQPFFTNLNDDTNEGIRHKNGRFISTQFHPEASPGPYDTSIIFDMFMESLDG